MGSDRDTRESLLSTASESATEVRSKGRPETVAEFQAKQGYVDNLDDLEMTVRACVIGALFACINGAVNMFFAFRYAGGLAQYWVILVAYPICKATELLPRGSLLNPGPFSPKEHCLVMTMAIAGSLAGTLGLSGGMLSLVLFFDTTLTNGQIFAWAFVAGFFGLFFGACMWETLVVPDKYGWPFSKANASFIGAFYRSVAEEGGSGALLRCFGHFFLVAFCWFCVPNYLVPPLLSVPLLCSTGLPWHAWRPVQPFGRGGIADLPTVLSSGVAGAGFPGLGGWASCWAYGPSIIPFETSVQIFVGVALMYWVFVPCAFFGGLAAWPSSFQEFASDGSVYNNTEGYHAAHPDEPIHLSAVGMTMYFGVALSILGMFTDTVLRLIGDRYRRARYDPMLDESLGSAATPPPRTYERPLSLWLGVLATVVLGVCLVVVVQIALPHFNGVPGLGMPMWGSVLAIVYSFVSSVGVCMVYATTGQQFSGGVCILAQLLCGVLVPGSARANIVAVMLVNSSVSQAQGVMGDLKTALYLGVRPAAMFQAQLFGALVGVSASTATFVAILQLADDGKIDLGSAEWPAIGAVSQTLNAKLFGEQGIAAVLTGPLLWIVVGCAVVGVLGTLLLHYLSTKRWWSKRWWTKFVPSPVLLGVAGLYGGINFAATSLLIVAAVYQVMMPLPRPSF
jgi:OPT family oligopeptide transporter